MGTYDVSLGPLLLGTTLNVTLLGMMLVQVYLYLSRFWGKDQTWINYMVLFLLAADFVNSALDVTFVYQYTITNFGNMQAIQVSNWVFNSDPVMTVILSSVCQSFFAWRVRLLTGRKWLFVLLLISIVIQFLMGVATTLATTIVKVFEDFQSFRVVVIIWLVLSSLTDTVIASTLVWYLRSHKTGYAVTDGVLTKLTKLTVETGMITAIWATIDLIVYLTFPNSLHLIFNLPLGKLYTNSLMSTLNSRANWAQDPSDPNPVLGLQKMSTGAPPHLHAQKVLWATQRHGVSGDSARPESAAKNHSRENGVLITSSTVVHRDIDEEYDLEDATQRSEFFVSNGGLGARSFVQSEATTPELETKIP